MTLLMTLLGSPGTRRFPSPSTIKDPEPSLSNNLRIASVVISIVCIVITALLIYSYFHRVSVPMPISNDSVFVYKDWLNGQDFWGRLRDTGVASWFSSLGLFLDIWLGPYPIWSYLIGYLLLGIFIGFLYVVSSHGFGVKLTLLFCAAFLLFWFSDFNHAQSYSYVWRIPEVGALLAALGSSVFIIYYLDRLSALSLYGLIFLTFVFSNNWTGYVPFIALLAVLLLLDQSSRRKFAYGAILAAYILYMFFLDGAFAFLAQELFKSNGPSVGIIEFIFAVFGLQTQSISGILTRHTSEVVLLASRVIFVVVFFWFCLHAVLEFFYKRDRAAAVFLFLVLSQLAIIVLAVAGRSGAYGMKVIDVPRYSSYSLVSLFALAWYAAVVYRPRVTFVLFVSMAVIGMLHAPLTYHKLGSIATKDFNHRQSAIYSVDLSGRVKPFPNFPNMSARQQSALLFIVGGLERRGAAGFGRGPWSALKRLEPIRHPAPQCGGRLQRISHPANSAYAVWDYDYSSSKQEPADFGFVLSAEGVPIALTREISIGAVGHLRFFVPSTSDGVTFYIGKFGKEKEAQPRILCRISPEQAGKA
jgi:hypothetical protein